MLLRFRLVFFLSGCAALMFEALWFRLATLAFGSSVWASSLVLASFMGGLALGNAWAGARGTALRRPLRVYAALELAIGVSGVALVVLLPALASVLSPVFRPFLEQPALLNTLRGGIAFALMLVPATAMGATLPIVVKELRRDDPNFGRNLGRLYGWNTLGGVAGALSVELVLIGPLGLRGSALMAAALNLAAAGLALAGDRARPVAEQGPQAAPPAGSSRIRRLLAAGTLSGAILLALEVVWFRFLLLFAFGSSRNFAIMLAVVLSGIALGALAASRWLGRRPQDHALAPLLALLAATACALAYRGFRLPGTGPVPGSLLFYSLWLMLPTSLLSGALFTFLGRALQHEVGDETRAAARLTLANTLGGMAGALVGGFVLLPALGMEASFFVLAVGYGLVAWCAARPSTGRLRWALWAAGGAAALSAALFPFGLMRDRFLPSVRQRAAGGGRVLAIREGRTETIQYLARDVAAQPTEYRLVTNSHSMSGTNFVGRRYMRLFATWAFAVNPRAESALLISYGVGTTAKALTDTARLRSIDVVDTSREILDLAPLPFPPPATSPLQDPRVQVHVEDGRFFLQTTPRRFDLVTAEPPPLKAAGVVNLYSREYFQLVRDRLAPGGVTTYWLPVYQLLPAEAASVVRAFCGVFEDCTLWTAAGLEWMLAGTNGARAPSASEFGAQWSDPVVGPQLRADGFESPEQLGACFLADAAQLAAFAATAPELVDDFPRLMSADVDHVLAPAYAEMMAVAGARRRFAESLAIARLWPEATRAGTDAWFGPQEMMNGVTMQLYGGPRVPRLSYLRDSLANPALVTLPLWSLGFTPLRVGDADLGGAGDAPAEGAPGELQAAQAMARRDYADAERRLTLLLERHPLRRDLARLRVLAALLGGDRERAQAYAVEAASAEGAGGDEPGVWEWLEDLLNRPAGVPLGPGS